MKSVKLDSSSENRKQLFRQSWPTETYVGSAEQNIKLLKRLLRDRQQLMLPFPSSSIDGCKEFYSDPEVAKYLSNSFVENATNACIVTGTGIPQNVIREKLQEEYKTSKPANGTVFTPEEHKKIHDNAYKAAGCKEESAKLWGWYVVDAAKVPAPVLKKAIELFGPCSISGD